MILLAELRQTGPALVLALSRLIEQEKKIRRGAAERSRQRPQQDESAG